MVAENYVPEDIAELMRKKICFDCVGEDYLREEMRKTGTRRKCSYCGKKRPGLLVGAFAERIEEAFEQHYTRTRTDPEPYEYTGDGWERPGDPIIYAICGAAEISEDAAKDVQAILEDKHYSSSAAEVGEESEFDSDTHYEEKSVDTGDWREDWQGFERGIKTYSRYFSRTAADTLHAIFDGIDTMTTNDREPVVVDAGPNTKIEHLFRARIFQSDDALEAALKRPDLELGSPPSHLAKAGRMNAQGISVFYGADDPEVALAEVRPPVGSKVSVARFTIIEPLRLLNLRALRDMNSRGSIFDPGFVRRLAHAAFCRDLSRRMSMPVLPDNEPVDYLATQAIADFLATQMDQPLHGILYPSVQLGGEKANVVLFHKASKVEELDLPKGTEVRVSFGYGDEDGWTTDYSIEEERPAPKPKEEKPSGKFDFMTFVQQADYFADRYSPDADYRSPSLRIDRASIMIHEVRSVAVSTQKDQVSFRSSIKDGKAPPF